MAGHRRKWLVASVLLAMVALLAWASLGRSGKMEVQLFFAGYTNYVETITNSAPGSRICTRNVFSAIVMATNSGHVTVELYGTMRRPGLRVPIVRPPRILKPSETVVVEIEPECLGAPWSTEFNAHRRGLVDRLYVNVSAKRGTLLKRVVTKVWSQPPEVSARLGPIPNTPLDRDSARECYMGTILLSR
jgi:hypothetical protein